jgi:hypothetical protein
MDIKEEFKIDRIVFLSKLYELCKYDTKIPADAFDVGRQLHFDDGKTQRIVNYLIEKEFIRKSNYDIPINTGDPPSKQNFLIVFITSAGIDELEGKGHEDTVSSIYHHYGDTYQTDIGSVDRSNIQIGSRESIQEINTTEAKNKELAEILSQLKNNISDLQPEQKIEIRSEIIQLENELSSHKPDKQRIEKTLGLLYNKIKDITSLIGIAVQLANWFRPP